MNGNGGAVEEPRHQHLAGANTRIHRARMHVMGARKRRRLPSSTAPQSRFPPRLSLGSRASGAIPLISTSPNHGATTSVPPTWGSKLIRRGFVRGASLGIIVADACTQCKHKWQGNGRFLSLVAGPSPLVAEGPHLTIADRGSRISSVSGEEVKGGL